jgi:MSHA biogenesis protein MshJ
MTPMWMRYCSWFDRLKPRERALVVVASLALAGFVPYALAIEPQLRESRRLAAQIETQGKLLATIRSDVAALAASNIDPDSSNRERVAQLTRQLRTLDDGLRTTQKGLVPADQMAKVLESLLDRNRGLRVVALRTLPPAPLLDRPAAGAAQSEAAPATPANVAKAAPGAAAGSGIYRHGVELVLQGSYAELSAYLEQIERLPTQMFWSGAVLDAENYPRVTLTLSIFTIGLEAAWLSV